MGKAMGVQLAIDRHELFTDPGALIIVRAGCCAGAHTASNAVSTRIVEAPTADRGAQGAAHAQVIMFQDTAWIGESQETLPDASAMGKMPLAYACNRNAGSSRSGNNGIATC